ncbi:MAG: TetR/AcrR family transcriptional regulator [Eubacteriales bacterium]
MSPRSEEQNIIIKDERREQILSAALKLFATKGFAATKISEIVEKAEMSHGLVYHYFKSKEEIFYELLKRAIQTSSESILPVEIQSIHPIDKVRQIARFILGAIENYEDTAYYFLIVVHASVMENMSKENEELLYSSNRPMKSMARIVKAGQEARQICLGDPMEITVSFFAAIQGLAIYKLGMDDFKMPDPDILVNMMRYHQSL